MKRRSANPVTLAIALALFTAGGCSRFNSPVKAQDSAAPIEFVDAWGVKGDAPGQLDDPVGIATDKLGDVYLTDAGSLYIHKFAPKGTPLLSFQEDPLKHPQSIAVDSDGAIYVTDPARASVFIFFPDDEHHHELRMKARGNAENSLSVAVDDDGLIYVLNADLGKVFIFSPRLRLERSWALAATSGARAHWGPLGLGVDGSLYLADLSANRLLRFSAEGQLLGTLAPGATEGGDPKISDEFAVSHDYIFVMDSNGSMLHVWTLDGKPKLDVDLAPQIGQGYRAVPPIALSPRRELFILDAPKSRVLRYRVNF